MMQLTVKEFGTLGILTLQGNISELQAGELWAYLMRGLNRVNRLIVNCEQLASIDMISLKLLCTAYRVSHVLKKDFALAGDRTTLFHRATGNAGYAHCSGINVECRVGCLWKERETPGVVLERQFPRAVNQ